MGFGLMGGIGEGMQQVGGALLNDWARQRDEDSYMRKLEAAEKARDARDAADRARQAEIEKATPVDRRTFLGDNAEGPPDIRFESVNRFGEPVASGSASEGERSMFQQGLLRDSQAARAAAEQAKFEREKFDRVEAGKRERALISANRPKGASSAPRNPAVQIRTRTDENGVEHDYAYNAAGELVSIDGKPVSGGSANSKPKSSYSQLWD